MPNEREPNLKRRRLAAALRAERNRAGLTTRELANRLGKGWSQSKVSRREGAVRRASVADVEAWTIATGTDPARRAELIEMAEQADIDAQPWEAVYADEGPDGTQTKYHDLDLAAKHIAIFQPAVFPGLVQTAEYARRVLELMRVNPAKIATTAARRIERQSVLYVPDKTIELVLTESVLRLRVNPPDSMRAQLDKLASVATLPNVTVAVVPLDAEVREIPQTPFVLREFPDGTGMVTIETLGSEHRLYAPEKIERFLSAMAGYLAVAATGEAAVEMIRAAAKAHD